MKRPASDTRDFPINLNPTPAELRAVVDRLLRRTPRRSAERAAPSRDTGRFASGHRVFRDGSMREDFGADR